MTFGAVILAGGESRRMGKDKAALTYKGESFLSILSRELSGFDERLLSVAQPEGNSFGLREIADKSSGRGPMSGIVAALEACESDALLFVPCDVPRFTKELGRFLCERLSDDCDGVIAVSGDGREHPLCAVYRKSALPAFKTAMARGENRIFSALSSLHICKARIWEGGFADELLTNINYPEEYQRLCDCGQIPVISIVGYSGCGKTTLIEKLLLTLSARGLRVAIIKHDVHDFEVDHEGKDTWRFSKAGSAVTVIANDRHCAIMENRPVEFKELLSRVKDVDLILTEGFKQEWQPKIAVFRAASGKPLPPPDESFIAIATDTEIDTALPQFRLDDTEGIADFICSRLRK